MPIKDIKDILNMDSKSEVLLCLPRDPGQPPQPERVY
jgi:hypothetical protein